MSELTVYEKPTCTTCRNLVTFLEGRDLSDDEIIKLMAEHPPLLQRPVVERGERAVLARPVERVAELL